MKVWYLLVEMFRLVKRHKMYFLAPILVMLVLLALLAFYIGPGALVTFIYAGV